MPLRIKRFDLLTDFRLRVEFTNGERHVVHLEPELRGEVFEPLRDPGFFSRARLNHDTGTVEWPNGADFAPEFLYLLATSSAATPGERERGP